MSHLFLNSYEEGRSLVRTEPDKSLALLKQAWDIAVVNEFDTLVPKILNSIGAFFANQQQYDSAYFYYKQVLNQEPKNIDVFTSSKLYGNLAILYNKMGKNDSALYYSELSCNYALTSGDSTQMMKCLFDKSKFENLNGNYMESIRLLGITEKYYLDNHNYNILAYTYNSLGIAHLMIKSDEAALYYLQRAIEVDLNDDSNTILEYTYNNLGQFYRERKHDMDSALFFYKKALELSEQKNLMHGYLGAIINIGNVYEAQEEYIQARDYYLTAIRKPEINNYHQERTAVTINLGVIQLHLKELLSARVYLEEGLKMAKEGGYLGFQAVSLESLLMLEFEAANALAAEDYFNQYKVVSDSIQGITYAKDITGMKVAFETDAALRQNEYLTHENSLKEQIIKRQRLTNWTVVFGLVILSLLLIYITDILKKQKKLYHELHIYNETIATQNQKIEHSNQVLISVNQTKDKLFSIIAHDFKSPLSAIQSYLEILDDDSFEFDGPRFKPLVRELRLHVDNTAHLLANLLDWAIAQQQGIKNTPKYINVLEETNKVVFLVTTNMKEKNQRLLIKIAENTQAWCDPQLFRNALLNILNNAIKFTPENGLVQISSGLDNDLIAIYIKDNGVGVEPENIEKLFDVGSGYHTNGTNEEKGTGLGLAMCREYVETMGGSISVTSKVGEGSTFCFTIRASGN